jgi:hypothetical protein
VKIFVSYSRRDAGDFARQIHESLMDEHQVFTDVNNIRLGDIWSNTIEKNISTCDIFIILVTHAALSSTEIEKEVLQAQKENKKIIPCIYRELKKNEIKWGLERIQGVEFDNRYELPRSLYSKIGIDNYISSNKIADDNKVTTSTTQVIVSNPKPKTFYGEKRIFVGRQTYVNKIKEYFTDSNDPIAVIGLGVLEKVRLYSKQFVNLKKYLIQ